MKEYEIEIHVTTRKKVKIVGNTEIEAINIAEVDIAEMLLQDEESGRNRYVGAVVQIPEQTYALKWEQE